MIFTRVLVLLLAALACAILALLILLGVHLGGSTAAEWAVGSLVAYYASHVP